MQFVELCAYVCTERFCNLMKLIFFSCKNQQPRTSTCFCTEFYVKELLKSHRICKYVFKMKYGEKIIFRGENEDSPSNHSNWC